MTYILVNNDGKPINQFNTLPIEYTKLKEIYGQTGCKLHALRTHFKGELNTWVAKLGWGNTAFSSIKCVNDGELPLGDSSYVFVEAKDILEALSLFNHWLKERK